MASQQPKEANQIRDAPDPFADLDADVIIRAGGAVDFRVHKFILIRAFDAFSSIFEDGSSTGGGQEYKNGLPIVPMQEAPDVVEAVLRLYYPGHTAPVYPLATLYSICRTLDKYCVKAYPPLLRRDLLAAATQYPSEIYAIACHYRLPEVGQAAARAMLPIDKPLMKLPDTFAVMVNGVQYDAFLRYMATCQQRSLDAVSNLDWVKSNSSLDADISKKGEGCTCKRTKLPGPTLSKVTVPLWLGDYLAGVHGCLSVNPSGTTALMPKHFLAAGVLNTRDCGTCRVVHIATQLPTLAALLQNEIDRRISGVMLPDSTFK